MSGTVSRGLPFGPLLACVLTVFASAIGVGAAEPVSGGSPLPSDPVFSALLVDGTVFSGRIRQISPEGDVALVPATGAERSIAFRQLLKLTREGAAPTLTPEGALVLFPDGDRLFRTVIGAATETALEVQPYAVGNLSIPLDSILGLVLTPPEDVDATDRLLSRVRDEPRSSEILWLKNGDRVAGGLLALDERRIKLQTGAGPIALDRTGVDALGFDPSLVSYPKPAGGYFELTMADGSRLGVAHPRVEQGQVIAETRFGATIRVALSELARVHVRSESVVYLSERPADGERYVSYVGPTRVYRRDASVDGHPLRLAGQTYDRGLGTQSRTLLAYRVAAGAHRFQALVGVDESAGPLGSVVFRVFVDGSERFLSPPLSVRDVPKAIDIDVTGAKTIILMTEFGERGEVRDFADWVEARIIR